MFAVRSPDETSALPFDQNLDLTGRKIAQKNSVSGRIHESRAVGTCRGIKHTLSDNGKVVGRVCRRGAQLNQIGSAGLISRQQQHATAELWPDRGGWLSARGDQCAADYYEGERLESFHLHQYPIPVRVMGLVSSQKLTFDNSSITQDGVDTQPAAKRRQSLAQGEASAASGTLG